ncbi:DHH family phosphoesterase, partial [Candidatus Micrarchaeota archaeon]|nr:DHH family phosphoesterase [Candidatus Micrarchaeota archaeon]
MNSKSGDLLIKDEATELMRKDFEEAASRIKKAISSGRSVLIRYHNDADGICSAVAMHKAIKEFSKELKGKVFFYQNNGATYTTSEVMKDISLLSTQEKNERPLVIIMDFGANEESFESISLLKSAGCEIIVIDHHPPSINAKDADLIVSPWRYGGGSEYCAGYLSAEVARQIADVEVLEIARVALTGDMSKLIEK